MNGQDFMRLANVAFVPFLGVSGFVMDAPSISGKFYSMSFTGPRHSVSVSYEPSDDVFSVMVFSRESNHLSDIDDRSKTPRLSDLNNVYMKMVTNDELVENEAAFKSIETRNNVERSMLKIAKELRLVLPKYLGSENVALFKSTSSA